MTSRKSSLAFLILVLIVASVFEVGSYNSHLANAIADDHPAVWAQIFSSPDFNRNDPNFQVAAGFIFSSLPNLITAYSGRVSNQLPDWICYLFLVIQTVGLGLALFVFCKGFIKDDFSALLTAVVTFFIHPWVFNLAYYPNLIFTPYAGQLVLPFIVLAASALLKNQIIRACVWLSISGLIHPALTLQFLVISFFYLLFTGSLREQFKNLSLLGIPALFSLLLPLWVTPKPAEPLSKAEILPSLLNHPHAFPWSTPVFWPWAVPSFLGILFLTGLSQRKKASPFFKASLLAVALLGSFHLASGALLFVEGSVFSGFRVTSLCSLLLLPYGVHYLLNLLSAESIAKKVWAFFVLSFFIMSQRGLPWVGLLALLILDNLPKSEQAEKRAKTFFFAWWIVFVFTLRPMRDLGFEDLGAIIRYVLAPAFSFTAPKYVLILMGALVLLVRKDKYKAVAVKASVAILLVLGLWGSFDTGASSRDPKKMAFVEVQNWAREKTPENTSFITTQWSWRGRSERPGGMVYKPPFKNQNPYFRFGQKKDRGENALEELFQKAGAETIGDLNETYLRELSKLMRTDFLVMEKDKEKRTISLPICFENAHYRVYDLSHSACSILGRG